MLSMFYVFQPPEVNIWCKSNMSIKISSTFFERRNFESLHIPVMKFSHGIAGNVATRVPVTEAKSRIVGLEE